MARGRPGRIEKGLLKGFILGGGELKAFAAEHGLSYSIVAKWMHDLGMWRRWLTDDEWRSVRYMRKKQQERRAAA